SFDKLCAISSGFHRVRLIDSASVAPRCLEAFKVRTIARRKIKDRRFVVGADPVTGGPSDVSVFSGRVQRKSFMSGTVQFLQSRVTFENDEIKFRLSFLDELAGHQFVTDALLAIDDQRPALVLWLEHHRFG